MEKFILEINNFGRINKAHVEINKINVVGGVNASGKSTASKVLYCFLRAMSLNRKDYVLNSLLSTINMFINIIENPHTYGNNDLDDRFTSDDNLTDILKGYLDAKLKYDKLEDYFDIQEPLDSMVNLVDTCIPILLDRNELGHSKVDNFLMNNKDNLIIVENSPYNVYNDSFYENAYSTILESLFMNESLLNFKGNAFFYNGLFTSSVCYENTKDNYYDNVEGLLELLSELGISKGMVNGKTSMSKDVYDSFNDSFIYSTKGNIGFINDVFYIDSISTFDLDFFSNEENMVNGIIGYKEHIENLLNQLKDNDSQINLQEDLYLKINKINELISNIVGGHTYRMSENSSNFNLDYFFKPKNSESQIDNNISSGIQQISIIQILLNNFKFIPESYLIIDEPEVNLHPEWQFKFAEILVLLAKELDITIYFNSHSPFFIEAIDAFTEFYDIQDEVNYYLTEESEVEGKYDFTKISSNELYKIYNNLGDVYKEINKLRLRKRLNR